MLSKRLKQYVAISIHYLILRLQLLQEGVVFDTPHGKQSFRGTLAIGSADNLASQLLGGFKALSGAIRKCRYCMAGNEKMQTKVKKAVENT